MNLISFLFLFLFIFFLFKQMTAYDMRISALSSDVCSSDLFRHPALVQRVGIGRQFITAFGAASERGIGGFGRKHTGFHRRLAALNARHVDETGGPADQRAAAEGELRHRFPASLFLRALAIRHDARRVQNASVSECISRWS